MAYENKLILESSRLYGLRRSFRQEELLLELKISFDHAGKEIKKFILLSKDKPDHWAAGGTGKHVASLIEQFIDERQYFLPFIKKTLDTLEPKTHIVQCQFKTGLWGNLIYLLTRKNKSRWMAKCRSKIMGHHYLLALLQLLNENQEQWLKQLSKCNYVNIDKSYVRIPVISLFPLNMGDMLRILNLQEQLLLSEIRKAIYIS
jgi:hypothetical protein